MKLIVLSDTHLMADGEDAHDLGNHARLDAAIDRINTAYSDADLVVLAGDLVDRGRFPQSYKDLKTALGRLSVPWAVTLGNHDHRENFVSVFGETFVDQSGYVQSHHRIGAYHVLVLDSLEKSEDPDWPYYSGPNGHLCQKRLAWLDAALGKAEGAPVIVVMHHPALPVGIKMDARGLADLRPLTERLSRYGNTRHVLSGHIHMTTTSFYHGVPYTTIAGGYSSSVEDFGRKENKFRREGPAQMAVLLGQEDQLTVHFDNYVDAHPRVHRD